MNNNNEKLEKAIKLLEELKNEQDVEVNEICFSCFSSYGKIIVYANGFSYTKEIFKSLHECENIKELDSIKFADRVTIPIRIGGNGGNTTTHNLRILLHYLLSKGYRIKQQDELSHPIELEKIK